MIRLWCATIYIFDSFGTQTLLINHHKLGRWVPPGGKIDQNEIPDDAALRECEEEVGLAIELIGETPAIKGCKVRPFGIQVNTVIPDEKEHIDLIYIGVPTNKSLPTVNPKEASQAQWFTLEEMKDPHLNTFPEVRQWVEKITREWPLIVQQKKGVPHRIENR